MPNYKSAIQNSRLTYSEIKGMVSLFQQFHPEIKKTDCEKKVLAIASLFPDNLSLFNTYIQVLKIATIECSDAPGIHQRSFAVAVAQLCHDDPRTPLDTRSGYLTALLEFSGGPTVREHAVMWSAFGQGDALQTEDMLGFYVDGRFPLPGTWSVRAAIALASDLVFGDIKDIHRKVWANEPNCYDDTPEDIAILGASK